MAEPAPPKQRIFIVEDESIVAADLAQVLTGLGYEVAGTAVSGPQALTAINSHPPDLVLMDIVLQGPMDGIETATHIRARHDVPIVYLTAYSDPEIISRAKDAEPYGYLIKPLAERELHATIELALAKSRVENRLRASESRFRELADFLPQPIFEADADGKITFANRRALEQFQLTGDDVARGINLLDFTVPEEREAARERYRERLAGAPPVGRVWRLRRKDGSVFPAEINTSPILDNQRPVGLRGFVLDLTDRQKAEAVLRASEERYRTLAETSQDFIYTIGRDGTILYVNRYGAEQFRVAPEALIGRRPADLFPPEVSGPQHANLERVFAGGEPLHVENQAVFPFGGLRWLDTHLFPLRGPRGEVEAVLGISRDVTDRRKSEEVSRAAAREWQNTFDAVSDAICLLDADGRIQRCNRGMAAMLGLAEDQVVGRPCWEIVHRTDQPIPDCPFVRVRATRRREIAEIEQDGRWLDITVDPFLDEQGVVTGAVHIVHDITPRKEAERARRESEEQFYKAFRANPLPVAIGTLDEGRFHEVNEAFLTTFGFAREEVIGRKSGEIGIFEDPEIRWEWIRQIRATGRLRNVEARLRNRQGKPLYGLFSGEIIRLGDGEYLLIVMNDITERRQAEEKIRTMNEALVAANRELQSLDAMKSNLLSTVTHELRTPLVSIRGYVEMISEGKSGPVSEKQRDQLGIAIRNIDRLVALINQLLDYSRLELGQFHLHRTQFDLRALAREAVQVILPKARERGLALELEPGGEPVPICADHDRLTQVCLNLMDNAIKFTESGGRITLRVEPPAGGRVRVTVSDTGIGIPPAEQEKVFQRFYQVDGTSTRRPRRAGMGIGLAICHELIKLHGGEIAVTSREGAGSTFAFTLPLAGACPAESGPGPGSGA